MRDLEGFKKDVDLKRKRQRVNKAKEISHFLANTGGKGGIRTHVTR